MPNTSWSRDNAKPSKSEKFRRFSKKVDGQIARIAADQAKPQNQKPGKKSAARTEIPETRRRSRGWG